MKIWPKAALRLALSMIAILVICLVAAPGGHPCRVGRETNQGNRRAQAATRIESDGGIPFFYCDNEIPQPCGSHRETICGVDYSFRESSLERCGKPIDLSPLEHLPEIRTLILSGQQIANEGLVHLSKLCHLRQLDLSWTAVDDEGLRHLRDVASLNELDLSHTAITDDGLRHLENLTDLQHLVLNDTKVTDIGLRHLSQLGKLEDIELRGTCVDGSGLDALSMSILRLNMSRSLAKDSTISSLSRFPNLKYLSLRDTRVTNRVCTLLDDMDCLEEVDLSWTFATGSGVESTAARLKTRIVVDTRLSDHEIDEIRKVVEATDGIDRRILGFRHGEHGQVHVFTGVNRGHLNGDGNILIMEQQGGKWTVVSISAWSS